jgi:hypothetical protein
MRNDTAAVLQELFSNPTGLLIFALVVLALFMGLLIFDPFKDRKRRHHGRHSPARVPRPTVGQRLGMPFVQIRALCVALIDLACRRARRRARAERLAEQMRRYSK